MTDYPLTTRDLYEAANRGPRTVRDRIHSGFFSQNEHYVLTKDGYRFTQESLDYLIGDLTRGNKADRIPMQWTRSHETQK